MIDLETILVAIVAYLETCLDDSNDDTNRGKMPEVDTVLLGDYPTPDAKKRCTTVDWAGDSMPPAFGMSPMSITHEIAARTYFSEIPRDDDINKLAREHRSSAGGTKGLIPCLRAFRGLGYMLAPISARYIQPEEKQGFRFTIGLEVRCTVRQVG